MGNPSEIVLQPPLLHYDQTLTVVINSMALGGAEWIVRDWILRSRSQWRIHLVLLHDRNDEWGVPSGVEVTRLSGKHLLTQLRLIGSMLAASDNPTCIAHLLRAEEQAALESGGAFVYQVFHNAQAGWFDQPEKLDRSKPVIAVSHAAKTDLLENGWEGPISVVHHLPRPRKFDPTASDYWRTAWKIPADAKVIGMIGSLKPQKDYVHALHVLRALLDQGHRYYLVILGGMVGRKDNAEAKLILDTIAKLRLQKYVAMPGPVPDAVQCIPAFNLILNTSHYEGLSVATLEVLASGFPVVATKVGGQGEVMHSGLTLVSKTAPAQTWVDAICNAADTAGVTPIWSRFPSYRLWTLHHLVQPFTPGERTLFLTANLNIGGAQRSLVNLVKTLDRDQHEVLVTGDSYADHFTKELLLSGVKLTRATDNNDPFHAAAAIVQHVAKAGIGTLVFWNTDAKLKLLLGKVLGHTGIRFVDVSPGGYAFESLDNMAEFGQRVCYSTEMFYDRLDHMVLKFHGTAPAGYAGPVSVIPNGVPVPSVTKQHYGYSGPPRIAMCGRITGSKFVLEVLEAMKIVRWSHPNAELHLYGGHRASDQAYVDQVQAVAGPHDHFHGPDFQAWEQYHEHDVFVVLGRHQGCPNAVLEALAVGVPLVANDDGGTGEQVIDNHTGRLISSVDPAELAEAILDLLEDRAAAEKMALQGQRRVRQTFSMERMSRRYKDLLQGPRASQHGDARAVRVL